MNGAILNFDATTGTGILRAEDGKRYSFSSSDWSSSGVAQAGDTVDFEPSGGAATEIFATGRAAQASATQATTAAPLIAAQGIPLVATPSAQPAETADTLQALPRIEMPSGNGAFFFMAYLVTMIPTYILVYFGSNSAVINGLGRIAGGGLPVQFWWHLTCYAILIFLAFTRGVRIARGWLITLPIVAMVFDFIPGLNLIPLVPTVLNLTALFIGTTRKPPEGFTLGNLDRLLVRSLLVLAAFCGFVIITLFTSNMSVGQPFVATLLIWPVLAAAVFFALRIQAANVPMPERHLGEEKPESELQEIPSEGQAGATPAPFDGTPATTFDFKSWIQTTQGRIVAGATVLVVAGGIGLLAFGGKKMEDAGDFAGADATAAAAAAGAAMDSSITGQEATLYIIADANVRDRPTAQGSTLVTKLARATAVTGTMQIGEDQTSAWFKLADGRGYIGGVNLSPNQPPALAKTFSDMKWNVETGTDLLATPEPSSAVVARLNFGDQTTVAGVTTNGYAEVKRSRGGVGYFLVNPSNDRNGALFVENTEDAADRGTVVGSIEANERRAVADILNLDNAASTEYSAKIGKEIASIKFNSDTAKKLLFGSATYQDAVTKEICETTVHFETVGDNNVMRLGQSDTKYGTPCRHRATIVVRPVGSTMANAPPNALDVDWMIGAQKLMSGRLILIDVS